MNERSLPKGWMWTTLQKVCSPPQYGWTTKASPQGALHLLRTTDITADNLNWGHVPFCSEEPSDKEKYMLKTGDIVISRAGSVGSSYLVENPPSAVFASYLIRFRPLPVINEYYLAFFLKSSFYWNTISSQKTGSTLPNVNATKLKQIPVPLPPLPEQRAIAHILQTIQEAKVARQRELALERERKAALMDHLFSHGAKGEPRKQTEIGEIPKSWEVVRLEEIVKESIKDGVHQTPVYVEEGVPFITAKDIIDNKISFANCAYISPEEHETLIKRVKPEIGDVLLTKVGTVGNVALVNISREFSIFVQVALIKPKSDIIDSGFLLYALQSEKGQTEINRKSAQSTMRFIGVRKISTVYIPLPSLPDQLEIAEILQACDTIIAALEQEAQRLDELFHAMLDELMTGKRSAVSLIDVESAPSA